MCVYIYIYIYIYIYTKAIYSNNLYSINSISHSTKHCVLGSSTSRIIFSTCCNIAMYVIASSIY